MRKTLHDFRGPMPTVCAVIFPLLCALFSSQFPFSTLVAQSPSNALAASVQPFVDRQELAGAVMLVANKDGILALEAAGWAEVAGRKPMSTNSIFWIASQSKPITAAAMMLLIENGKASLDDPVEKYLPEFNGQWVVAEKDADHQVLRKPKHPITIRNVLSHTSGLPFRSAIEEPTLDRFPLATRVRSYAMLPLEFEPDSRYSYSNAGINTAARIIEVISGMPFERFLEEKLLDPCGMMDTTFWPTESQAARIAGAYKPGPDMKGLQATTIGQLQYPLTDLKERYPMPAGGLFSTAADLSRFYRMLLNGGQLDGKRILSEESVRSLTQRQTQPTLKDSYGLGFAVGADFFGHGGAYSTDTRADTGRGLIFVWLVQHAGFPGEGGKAHEVFQQAAIKSFAPAR